MQLEFFRQIFYIYSNIKFHENPSIGSRVIPCGQTKLKVALHNSANAPKTKCVTVVVYLKLVTWGCLRTISSSSLGSNFEVQ